MSYQSFLFNFNRVRRRLLGFLGYSLLHEDSYIFFADLVEASSHIIYYNGAACLEPKIFHGRLLSIRVFSSDGHYALIVSLGGWTLSRHVINLNQ